MSDQTSSNSREVGRTEDFSRENLEDISMTEPGHGSELAEERFSNQNVDRNNSNTELRSDQDTMTRDKSEVSSELNDRQRTDDGDRERNHDHI